MGCLIALDLETTGLNSVTDKILEIGAIKIVDGKVVDKYECFVNPQIPISERITEITGITNEMVKDGKSQEEALNFLLEFCGEYPILGHNIQFDYNFIKQGAMNYQRDFACNGYDTLKMARALLPEVEKKTLEYLSTYFQIPHENKHRAYCDAYASYCLYEKLKTLFFQEFPEVFVSYPLHYKGKKQSLITPNQKKYLKDLLTCHKIDLEVSIECMTKSEASKMIDKIIFQNGKK